MTPADLQIPERGSVPVDDPAITAAKEEEAAKAAWLALPADTLTDAIHRSGAGFRETDRGARRLLPSGT